MSFLSNVWSGIKSAVTNKSGGLKDPAQLAGNALSTIGSGLVGLAKDVYGRIIPKAGGDLPNAYANVINPSGQISTIAPTLSGAGTDITGNQKIINQQNQNGGFSTISYYRPSVSQNQVQLTAPQQTSTGQQVSAPPVAPTPGYTYKNIGGEYFLTPTSQALSGSSGSGGSLTSFTPPQGYSGTAGSFSQASGVSGGAGISSLMGPISNLPTQSDEEKQRQTQTKTTTQPTSSVGLNLMTPTPQGQSLSQGMTQTQTYQKQPQITQPTSQFKSIVGQDGNIDLGSAINTLRQNNANITNPDLKASFEAIVNSADQIVQSFTAQKMSEVPQEPMPKIEFIANDTSELDQLNSIEGVNSIIDNLSREMGLSTNISKQAELQASLDATQRVYQDMIDKIDSDPNLPVGLARRRMEAFAKEGDRKIAQLTSQLKVITDQITLQRDELRTKLGLYQDAAQRAYNERQANIDNNRQMLNMYISSGAIANMTDQELQNIATQSGATLDSIKAVRKAVASGNETKIAKAQADLENKLLQTQLAEEKLNNSGSSGNIKTSNKVFSQEEYNKMNMLGLDPTTANQIYQAIANGHTLEDIRQAIREGGKDPVILDYFDKVVNIKKVTDQLSGKSSREL